MTSPPSERRPATAGIDGAVGLARVVRPIEPRFAWARDLFTFGVTGTNGKTSSTHLIAAVLRAAGKRVVCQSTLGYFLDTEPVVVERTETGFFAAMKRASEAGCSHAAIEVTSKALRRGYARKWRFDLGVFTNLTRDHLAEHGSWEDYLASKAQLFVTLGSGRTAVLNAHDEASLLLDRVIPPDVHRRWYGAHHRGRRLAPADLAAREITPAATGTTVDLEPSAWAELLGGTLELPLVGEVFAENALAVCCAALAAGVEPQHVTAGLRGCPPLPGRFEVVARDPTVVLDYAHTPDALARLCDTARRLAGAGRVIVVFGAGGGYDPAKRGPMGEAVGARVDLAIVTNDNPRHEDPSTIARAVESGCRRAGRATVRLVYDRREAIQAALQAAAARDIVVVAGRGHDQGMSFKTGTVPYSDLETVQELLGGRTA